MPDPKNPSLAVADAALHPRSLAYLAALDLDPGPATLDLACAIQQRHLAAFTFNSLAVLAGEDVAIDSAAVFDKIVRRGRGGYCFEHNKLIFDVLQDLGFDVTLRLARVLSTGDPDVPRTHRFTLLRAEGSAFIVDGGFGPNTPLRPVEFALDAVQEQGREAYRVVRSANGDYQLQRRERGAFAPLYSFDDARYTEADCLTGHFYSHRHPAAVFVNNLVVSSRSPERTWSLRNHQLFELTGTETTITRIETPEQLRRLLLEAQGLDLEASVCRRLFEDFVAPHLEEDRARDAGAARDD